DRVPVHEVADLAHVEVLEVLVVEHRRALVADADADRAVGGGRRSDRPEGEDEQGEKEASKHEGPWLRAHRCRNTASGGLPRRRVSTLTPASQRTDGTAPAKSSSAAIATGRRIPTTTRSRPW